MRVSISPQNLCIETDCVEYDSYWLECGPFPGDARVMLRLVVKQWARALERLMEEGQEVFLPFSLDDQSVTGFRAVRLSEGIVLRCRTVDEQAHNLDLLNLAEFMCQRHDVLEECSQDFGRYPLTALIEALDHAELTT